METTYPRAKQPGERYTVYGHLPPEKVAGLTTTRETCAVQAADIGPSTAEVVTRLLAQKSVDRLLMVKRVLGLAGTYGALRLERACRRALQFEEYTGQTIRCILEKGLDMAVLPPLATAWLPAPQFNPFGRGVVARPGRCVMELTQELTPQLKRLRLSGVLETLELRNQQAIQERLSYVEFLARLIQDEVERRTQKQLQLRVRRAAFRSDKTLESFDFGFNPAINRQQVLDLAACHYIAEHRNVLVCGPTGVGKTHLAVALGIKAVEAGYSALFLTFESLMTRLVCAKYENRLDRALQQLSYPKLLIIDEIGYLPLAREEASLFFRLVVRRYERVSLIVTSNKSFLDWGEVFSDPILATAILDRLLHYSTTLNIKGESYRLQEKRRAGLLGRPKPAAETPEEVTEST